MSDIGSDFDLFLGNDPRDLASNRSKESNESSEAPQSGDSLHASSTNQALFRNETRLMAMERKIELSVASHDGENRVKEESSADQTDDHRLTREIVLPHAKRPRHSVGMDSVASRIESRRSANPEHTFRAGGFDLGPSLLTTSNFSASTGSGFDAALNSDYRRERTKRSRPQTGPQSSQSQRQSGRQGGRQGGRQSVPKQSGPADLGDDFDLPSIPPSEHHSFTGAGEELPIPSPLSSTGDSNARRQSGDAARRGMPTIPEESDSEPDLRPRDPHELDVPVVFKVPVDEMQDIVYRDDENMNANFLEQRLEWSESESESEESDLGSIAEMIDDSSDSDFEVADKNEEYKPLKPDDELSDGSTASDDDDEEAVHALTESESEREDDETVNKLRTVSQARALRGKRHRIPTVEFWNGERIEYERDAKSGLLTAVEVRRVVPAMKTYRPRRRRRRHVEGVREIAQGEIDELEADTRQPDIQVPIFDPRDRQWHTETVAKSVVTGGFRQARMENGAPIPHVYRNDLFGNSSETSPFQIYMLRIDVGGSYSRLLESSKSSLYLGWSGRCTIQLNSQKFELPKGLAAYAPPANDLFIENGSDDTIAQGPVILFVLEFDGAISQEFAHAMIQGAASLVSRSQIDTSDGIDQSRIETRGRDTRDTRDEFDYGEDFDGGDLRGGDDARSEFSRVSVASSDSFARGFSRAVGNPELSDTRQSGSDRPVRAARSESSFSESLSMALKTGPKRARAVQTEPVSRRTDMSELAKNFLISRHRQLQAQRESE